MRKKVPIDLLELFRAQMAGRTVLEEALVPGLNFLVGELRVLAEVLKHFRLQFTAPLSHYSFLLLNYSTASATAAATTSSLARFRVT